MSPFGFAIELAILPELMLPARLSAGALGIAH